MPSNLSGFSGHHLCTSDLLGGTQLLKGAVGPAVRLAEREEVDSPKCGMPAVELA
jgi:hypothetical protein